jgi:hypothetical protein
LFLLNKILYFHSQVKKFQNDIYYFICNCVNSINRDDIYSVLTTVNKHSTFFYQPSCSSEANMVDTCKHFEIGSGSVRSLSHLPVFVIEHLCRAKGSTNTKQIKKSNDFKIVLKIKTYVSCRRHDYIIQRETRVLLSNLKKAELSLKVS